MCTHVQMHIHKNTHTHTPHTKIKRKKTPMETFLSSEIFISKTIVSDI